MTEHSEKQKDDSSPEDNSGKGDEVEHPISVAIDDFVHAVLDIRECFERLVPIAIKQFKTEIEDAKNTLEEGRVILESNDNNDNLINGIKAAERGMRHVKRLKKSNSVETLITSLFVNLFSAFDKFTGSLLLVLYARKQELFNSIEKEIALSEVLQFDSLDELKKIVLDK